MFRDNLLVLDSAFTVSTNAATTSYIDFVAAGDAMDFGDLPTWRVLVQTSYVGTNSAGTLTFQLHTCPNALFDSNAITLAAVTVNVTNLVAQTAGAAPPVDSLGRPISPVVVALDVPSGLQRYLRGYYLYSTTANFTTGPVIINEIALDMDKLISPTLGYLQK